MSAPDENEMMRWYHAARALSLYFVGLIYIP